MQFLVLFSKELKLEGNKDPGVFYINFKNWRQIFTNLFFVFNFRPSWSFANFIDKWPLNGSGEITKEKLNLYASNNNHYLLNLNTKNESGT